MEISCFLAVRFDHIPSGPCGILLSLIEEIDQLMMRSFHLSIEVVAHILKVL